ncbi:MAG: alpha/beta hydrolase, partial [Planctomycetota bacterium]
MTPRDHCLHFLSQITRLTLPFVICVAVSVANGDDAGGGRHESKSPTDQDIREESLIYKTIPTVEIDAEVKLRIDVTKPAGWKAMDQRPGIVFFHGGGWVGGKPGQFAEHSQRLAELGCVCFRVQ